MFDTESGILRTHVRPRQTSTTLAPPPAIHRSFEVHAVQSGNWPDSEQPDAPVAHTPRFAKEACACVITAGRPTGIVKGDLAASDEGSSTRREPVTRRPVVACGLAAPHQGCSPAESTVVRIWLDRGDNELRVVDRHEAKRAGTLVVRPCSCWRPFSSCLDVVDRKHDRHRAVLPNAVSVPYP